MSRKTFWEAVRTECAELEAKAEQYDVCRANLSEVSQYRDELHGQIEVYKSLEAERLEAVRAEALAKEELSRRLSSSTWLGIVFGTLLLGFGAGLVVGL